MNRQKKIKELFAIIILLFFSSCATEKIIDLMPVKPSKDWSFDLDRIARRNGYVNNNDSLIVFVGSSTFDRWSDLQSHFPSFCTVNNGISGFCLNDIISHYIKLIKERDPKIIVLYYGDNDIDTNKNLLQLKYEQQLLFSMIEKYNSESKVVLISIKHSPARDYQKVIQKSFNMYNDEIFRNMSNYTFFDINSILLINDKYQQDKYQKDRLHINDKAYKELSDSLNVIFKKIVLD